MTTTPDDSLSRMIQQMYDETVSRPYANAYLLTADEGVASLADEFPNKIASWLLARGGTSPEGALRRFHRRERRHCRRLKIDLTKR